MGKFTTFFAVATLSAVTSGIAMAASPDVYVVNFKNEKNAHSQTLDTQLNSALAMTDANVEHVVIDTTTAARWEKGAHEAFDRDIVPVFNKWVGLPGFAAIVDAKSKQVLGCLNPQFNASEMASTIKTMASKVTGNAQISRMSFTQKTTQCPPAFNTPPQ